MIQQNSFSQLIAQLMRRLNLFSKDQVVCYGVTLPQCFTIDQLEINGQLSMNELSRLQGVTVSTMTRVIDVLVRDGIVERVTSPGDRRKVCIQLTAKGKELAVTLKKCTDDYTLRILDRIPKDKHQQVIEALQLFSNAIGEVSDRCC